MFDSEIAEAEAGLSDDARAAALASRKLSEFHAEEEARADRDYDSDDSDDMQALLDRNTRRRDRAAAISAAAAAASRTAATAAALTSPLIDERLLAAAAGDALAAAEGGGGGAGEGVALPLAPGCVARGDPSLASTEWTAPFGIEPARYVSAVGALAPTAPLPRLVLASAPPSSAGEWVAAAGPPALVDVGPATVAAILEAVEGADAVVVLGPLGALEAEGLGDTGTADLWEALREAAARGVRTVAVGGALCAFGARLGSTAGVQLVSEPGALALLLGAASAENDYCRALGAFSQRR